MLSPLSRDWKIKVRVTKKGNVRSYNTAKGKGSILNCDLVDRYGTMILCTLFTAGVELYGDLLQEGKVYEMSGGLVKPSNKKFTNIPNQYCIIFDKNSKIKSADDDERIGSASQTFKGIDEICKDSALLYFDFIGIVHHVGGASRISTKTGECREKRNVILADDSGLTISA